MPRSGGRPFAESPLLTAVLAVTVIAIGRHVYAAYRLRHARHRMSAVQIPLSPVEAMELLLSKMGKTKSNPDFPGAMASGK